MRVADLLHPQLHGVGRVILYQLGGMDIGRYLQLPEGIELQQVVGVAPDEAPPAADALFVALAGPDARNHTPLDKVFDEVLSRVVQGTRGLLLFGFETRDLPLHRIVQGLGQRSCQVLDIATLDYLHIHSGIVFECVDRLRPLTHYLSGRNAAEASLESLPAQLRLVNEYKVTDFVARAARREVLDASATPMATAITPRRTREDAAGRIDQLRTENRRLAEQARNLETQFLSTQRRIAEIEASTTYRLGQTLASAGRNPRAGARQLPAKLLRLYRGRGGWEKRSPSRAAQPATPAAGALTPVDDAHKFLAYRTVTVTDQETFRVAGIWPDDVAATFAPDCAATTLDPNDALELLERVQPDVLIIDSAASRPGQPWALLGAPAGTVRDRQLARLLDHCRMNAIPTVLWWTTPTYQSPGLHHVAEQCDLVLADQVAAPVPDIPSLDRGLQLARFNTIGRSNGSGVPVHVRPTSARGVQSAPLLATLQAAVPHGLKIYRAASPDSVDNLPPELAERVCADVSWRVAPRLYQQADVFVSTRFSQSGAIDVTDLEQVACGGLLVCHAGDPVKDLLGDLVHVVGGGSSAEEAVDQAVKAAPASALDTRRMLRETFAGFTTRTQLSRLAIAVGATQDPLRGRDVAVLADLARGTSADQLVASVLGQQHKPSEVVIGARDGLSVSDVSRAMAECEGAGLTVSVVADDSEGDRRDLDQLAATASAEWISYWSPGRRYPATFLVDLLIGAETARADVVGYGEVDYEFTSELRIDDVIVRRQLVFDQNLRDELTSPGRLLTSWMRRGIRLFALQDLGA